MKDRTVGQIVDEVMAAIPDKHKHYFDKVMDDLLYTAPEIINNWFNGKFLRKFNEVIPFPPIENWHFVAVAALTRKSVAEILDQSGQKQKEE